MKENTTVIANKFLFNYLNRHFGLSLSIFLFGLAGSMAAFFLTLLVGDFFVLHFQLDSSKGRLLEMAGIQLKEHRSYFSAFLLGSTIKLLMQFAETYLASQLSNGLVWSLKKDLFLAHLETRSATFPTKSKEKYILNFTSEWRGISQWISKGLVFPAKDIVFLFAGLMLISRIDGVIAVTIMLSILSFAWLISGIARIQLTPLLNKRYANGAFLNFVTKVFYSKSARLVSASNEQLQIEFEKRAAHLKTTNRKNQIWESLLNSLIPVLPFLIMGIILLEISVGFTEISGSQGLLIILFLLLTQGALRRIFKAPSLWRKGQVSITKILTAIKQTSGAPALRSIPLEPDLELSRPTAGAQ